MSILDEDFVSDTPEVYETATGWQRFFNLLVDYIAIVAIYVFLLLTFELEESRIIGTVLMFVYYFFMEWLTKGRTIGKFLTRTKVLTVEGAEITAKQAALRSGSRLVPFEAFSFLGAGSSGWHDQWTDTMVVQI